MTVTEYTHLDLVAPTRVHIGRKKTTEVDAVNGTRIRKVVDGTVSYFLVDGPSVVPGLEIYAVAGATPAQGPAVVKAKGGKAPDGA